MCGIFGIVTSNSCLLTTSSIQRAIRTLLKLSESRGKESSGVIIRDNSRGVQGLFKGALTASRLSQTSHFKKLEKFHLTSHRPGSITVLGHARLVTNGDGTDNHNNQPVVKQGISVIHNGIVVNVEQLWSHLPPELRNYEVDTEVIATIIDLALPRSPNLAAAVTSTFQFLEGASSIAVLSDTSNTLVLGTNNGSLYWTLDQKSGYLLFASERLIVQQALDEIPELRGTDNIPVIHGIAAGAAIVIDPEELNIQESKLAPNSLDSHEHEKQLRHLLDSSIARGSKHDLREKLPQQNQIQYHDYSEYRPKEENRNPPRKDLFETSEKKFLTFPLEEISRLRRCSRCILPETFPFIRFNSEGVCNFCLSYRPMRNLGREELEEALRPYRSSNGSPDCLVTFSGGRDSSYGLHVIREELGMNPIAYTYDWGMVTDLARRNQSRLTGKLGIEHILVSADIRKKRANIAMNVAAWLARPSLGTIPLFMAGDKQYFYYANQLSKANNLKLVILCENLLETTNFKAGFCGIAPNFGMEHTYSLGLKQKMQMLSYYGKEFLFNPRYLNSSLLDTISAFCSYYVIEHNYLNLFNYLRWNENTVEQILAREYDWELAEDTPTTWRIGDGTAAFYNYIYYTLTGFSEFDTFRSNQIRENMITREQALDFVNRENAPRYESIRWYLDTIGLDFKPVIERINSLPRLYRQRPSLCTEASYEKSSYEQSL